MAEQGGHVDPMAVPGCAHEHPLSSRTGIYVALVGGLPEGPSRGTGEVSRWLRGGPHIQLLRTWGQ